MVRGNQKDLIETVGRAGIVLDVEAGTELSPSPRVIETRAEMLDEAGIT